MRRRRPRYVVRIPLTLAALGLILSLVACDENPDEIRSGRERADSAGVLSISDTAASSLPSELASLVERIRETRVAWSVGTLHGPPETRWGLLIDAEVDARGRVFALDRLAVEVRAFDTAGAFLGSFLSQGGGPLEMRQPWGIEALAGDSLLVFSSSEALVVPTGSLDDAREARRFTFHVPSVRDLCADRTALYARLFTLRSERGPFSGWDPRAKPDRRGDTFPRTRAQGCEREGRGASWRAPGIRPGS